MFAPPGHLSAAAQAAVAAHGTPATLNLDDIFGDVMFTPDGETVFLSEQQDEEAAVLPSNEKEVTYAASKAQGDQFVPVPVGGGLYTTQLHEREKRALTMGAAAPDVKPTERVPFRKAPQERHHLQYAAPKKKPSSSRSSDRKMSEQQKSERR